MKPIVRNLLVVTLVILVGASGTWAWYRLMEQVWEARVTESDAARFNPMLASAMLLRQSGHQVNVAGALGEVALDQLPDGTLILADSAGVMPADQAKRLLAWVQRGNTLLTQPHWLNDAEADLLNDELSDIEQDEEGIYVPDKDDDAEAAEEVDKSADATTELVESDPLGERFGVRRYFIAVAPPCEAGKKDKRCKPVADGKHVPVLRSLTVPGASHKLELDAGRMKLISLPDGPEAQWSDADNNTVRVYPDGKGRVVMLADDFFSNHELRKHDHGELLLALAGLNPKRHVTIVQNLDALRWYQLLWQHFSMPLLALAALLALLFWAAVRRFGPMLPPPVTERRSLMEHIDAAGAWLWKAKHGRQVLLDAARSDTLGLIKRRAPALFRLPEQALCAALARQCQLPEEHVAQALHHDEATTPILFTRQIRILQELRNHYER